MRKNMEIVNRPINSLKHYDKNARVHDDDQIAQLVKSIKKFGFTDPVEVSPDLVIISGHARVRAAQLAGLNHIPTIVHSHLTKTATKAYTLAANRIAQSASWSHD